MRRNWMPLYIPDFLADTVHLSAAETGAYLCLIMDYWLHDGLPDDDHKLASIARVPIKSWRQMRPTIEAFFRRGWRHKRIDAELAKMAGTMERRHAAATRAGNASWMAREKKATKRSTDVQRHGNESLSQRSTSDQRNVNHLTQESITTTFSGAARASQNEQNPPENEPNQAKPRASIAVAAPAGFAEQAREALAKNTGIGSGELTAVLQAKGWVKPC